MWYGLGVFFLSLEELDTVEKIESKLESKRYYEYRAYALLAWGNIQI